MNEEQGRRRRTPTVALLSVAGLALAGSSAGLALSNDGFKKEIIRLTEELRGERDLRTRYEGVAREATERAKKNASENESLRKEAVYREEVLAMETKARKKAEKDAREQKKRAELAEAKAAEEKLRADTAEHERDEQRARADTLEREWNDQKRLEEEASKRNLGNAIEVLERLAEKFPEHDLLEGAQRRAWLKYDCSLLSRLRFDLNLARGDDAEEARNRRDQLASRYEETCNEVEQ